MHFYPVTTHDIVNVVAKLSRTNTDAGTEAKLIMSCPFMILLTRAEAVAVDERSDCSAKKERERINFGERGRNHIKTVTWVPLAIGTSIVEFASFVTRRDVDLCEVTDSGDLNIFWSLDKVDALPWRVLSGKTRAPRPDLVQ